MSRHNLVKSIWIFFFGVWLQAVAISDSCYISCLFANITLRATQTRVDFCCLCVPVFPILWCFSHKQLPWHAHQSIYNSMYARLFNPLSTVQLAVNLIILCSLSTKKKCSWHNPRYRQTCIRCGNIQPKWWQEFLPTQLEFYNIFFSKGTWKQHLSTTPSYSPCNVMMVTMTVRSLLSCILVILSYLGVRICHHAKLSSIVSLGLPLPIPHPVQTFLLPWCTRVYPCYDMSIEHEQSAGANKPCSIHKLCIFQKLEATEFDHSHRHRELERTAMGVMIPGRRGKDWPAWMKAQDTKDAAS